jgi:hypothetical protein
MLGRPGRWGIAALLICASASAFGQAVGILTVAEGPVVLVRGTTTYTATQGVSVHNGDMLASDAKGQAQIEFDDGAILNLSRGARALVLASQGPGTEPGVALQSGWVKFTRSKAKSKAYRYTLPLVRLTTAAATGVLRVGGDSSELFIESGAARLVELQRNGTAAGSRDLKGGEFVVRRDGQPLALSARPSSDFVKGMPAYFRDDLPAYQSRARSRSVEPKREHEATYEEVEPWLKASLPVRRGLAERFHARAKDAPFHGKLVENLAAHPEWDPILYPEKYRQEEEKDAGKAGEAKKVQ